jgi:hypothetical protein
MVLDPQGRDPKTGKWLPHTPNTRKSIRDPRTGKFESPYERLRRRVKTQTPEQAWRWFREQIKKLGIPDPMTINQAMRLPIGQNNAQAMIGQIFAFVYDPKHKETLPVYDKFPLALIFEFRDDGFLALNTHYLPKIWRFRLLAKLMEIAESPMMPNDKLAVSWELLGNIAKYPEARPAVHRYLANHVRSRLMRIDPIDWPTAVALGTESFEKKTREEVWRESARKIRNLRNS